MVSAQDIDFYIPLREGKVILKRQGDGSLRFPKPGEIALPEVTFRIGPALGFEPQGELPEGAEAVGLRESWSLLGDEKWALAAKAAELTLWWRTTRYCPHCGKPLERASEISKRCPGCGDEIFPRLNPAILVLIRRGEEALLVRGPRRRFFALVAGFVETGESLEQCVAREVMEETSLRISDIRYFGSQGWPFPSQLMVAFTARYAGGELRFADGELCDGRFFRRDEVPELPTQPSLSRRLIDAWIEGKLQ